MRRTKGKLYGKYEEDVYENFDEYCTPTMQNRLQQHQDFNKKLKDDPIKTLKAMKILIYNLVKVVYPLEALTNALKNFLLTRQNKGESTIQ